jgi:hypothetical protein
MTPEQIDIIRKSFDAMWSMRGDIADLCYSRLFELAPDARDLFPSDMERQRVKLMDMIAGWSARSTSPRCSTRSSRIQVANTPDLGFGHRIMTQWARP